MSKDGGPAFPTHLQKQDGYHGMSLRDYATIEFTKAWIIAMAPKYGEPRYETWDLIRGYALDNASFTADAMLVKRQKEGGY